MLTCTHLIVAICFVHSCANSMCYFSAFVTIEQCWSIGFVVYVFACVRLYVWTCSVHLFMTFLLYLLCSLMGCPQTSLSHFIFHPIVTVQFSHSDASCYGHAKIIIYVTFSLTDWLSYLLAYCCVGHPAGRKHEALHESVAAAAATLRDATVHDAAKLPSDQQHGSELPPHKPDIDHPQDVAKPQVVRHAQEDVNIVKRSAKLGHDNGDKDHLQDQVIANPEAVKHVREDENINKGDVRLDDGDDKGDRGHAKAMLWPDLTYTFHRYALSSVYTVMRYMNVNNYFLWFCPFAMYLRDIYHKGSFHRLVPKFVSVTFGILFFWGCQILAFPLEHYEAFGLWCIFSFACVINCFYILAPIWVSCCLFIHVIIYM